MAKKVRTPDRLAGVILQLCLSIHLYFNVLAMLHVAESWGVACECGYSISTSHVGHASSWSLHCLDP